MVRQIKELTRTISSLSREESFFPHGGRGKDSVSSTGVEAEEGRERKKRVKPLGDEKGKLEQKNEKVKAKRSSRERSKINGNEEGFPRFKGGKGGTWKDNFGEEKKISLAVLWKHLGPLEISAEWEEERKGELVGDPKRHKTHFSWKGGGGGKVRATRQIAVTLLLVTLQRS